MNVKEQLMANVSNIYSMCISLHERPDKLYHYTGVEGVYNIINKKRFWLTKSNFLNDGKELDYFYDVLEEVMKENNFNNIDVQFINGLKKEASKKLENTFILSFTVNDDSLPLWEMYANGKGYNIEVDNNKFFDQFWYGKMYMYTVNKDKIYLTRKNDDKRFCGVEDFVVYNKKIQKTKIKEILQAIDSSIDFIENYSEDIWCNVIREMRDRILSEFIKYIILFKDESFAYEKEYRIAYNIVDKDLVNIVKHRIIHDRIVPYIELGVEDNIINSIGISPRLKKDTLFVKGMKSFINSINMLNDSYKIKVVYSQCNIR